MESWVIRNAPGADRVDVALLAVAGPCLFGLAALSAWSAWWPHSDNRQNIATVFMFLTAMVGLPAAMVSLFRTRHRALHVVVLCASVLLGASLGFWALMALTTDAGSGGGGGQPIPVDDPAPPESTP